VPAAANGLPLSARDVLALAKVRAGRRTRRAGIRRFSRTASEDFDGSRRGGASTADDAGVDVSSHHDLGHYFALGLGASGCDVMTVTRALGHAEATVRLDTYAHLWPTAEDRTRTAAAGLMRAAIESPADSLRTGESHDSRGSQ
jgi:integrase